jgi:hypothetical protein
MCVLSPAQPETHSEGMVRTANRRWFWILVLLQAASRTASARETASTATTRLQLEIVFDGMPMPPQREAEAVREADLIWARYGVNVRTPGTSVVESHSAVRLPVRFIDRKAHVWTAEPLGSIRFVGETPEPALEIYPNAIAALVSTVEFMGRGPDAWVFAFRELILGRVLGRALAHEIGHFLLRTTHHSKSGLMRALQPAQDLVDTGRRGFVLSVAEETRLASSVPSYFRPSSASVSLARASEPEIECDSPDGL